MGRKRKTLDIHVQGEEVLQHFKKEKPGWRKERLLSVKLGLEEKLTNKEISGDSGLSPGYDQ